MSAKSTQRPISLRAREDTHTHTHTYWTTRCQEPLFPHQVSTPTFWPSFSLALQIVCRESEPKSEVLPPGELCPLVERRGSSLLTLFQGKQCPLQSYQHSTFSPFHFPAEGEVWEGTLALPKALLCAKLWARCFAYIALESTSSVLVPTTHSHSAPEKQHKHTENLENSPREITINYSEV